VIAGKRAIGQALLSLDRSLSIHISAFLSLSLSLSLYISPSLFNVQNRETNSEREREGQREILTEKEAEREIETERQTDRARESNSCTFARWPMCDSWCTCATTAALPEWVDAQIRSPLSLISLAMTNREMDFSSYGDNPSTELKYVNLCRSQRIIVQA